MSLGEEGKLLPQEWESREELTALSKQETTPGMEIPGPDLMMPAEARPGQHPFHIAGGRPDETAKQMTYFRDGQSKQQSDRCSTINSRWQKGVAGQGSCGRMVSAEPCQKSIREHHEGDMAIPADEATDLIVIKTEILTVLEIDFDLPTRADGKNHLLQGRASRSKDEGEGALHRLLQAATHQHPMGAIVVPPRQDRHESPIEEPGAFGSLIHGDPLPVLRGKQAFFSLCYFSLSAPPVGSQDTHWFIARDSQDVAVVLMLAPGS